MEVHLQRKKSSLLRKPHLPREEVKNPTPPPSETTGRLQLQQLKASQAGDG